MGVASPGGCGLERGGAPSEALEGEGDLSGVSDISSEFMNREPSPSITGPQTPPPPSETTPSSCPAGVSDISSDNMEMDSFTHSADVSISETSMDVESEPGSEGPRVGVAGEAGSMDEAGGNVSVEGEGAVSSDGEARDDFCGSECNVQTRTPESTPGEGVATGRPPPLDSLGVAPLSPLSAQATPSRTPGKRKVRDRASAVLF